MLNRTAIGVLLALAAAFLFGLNASTSKVIMSTGISPDLVVLFRSFAAAAIAGIVLIFKNRSAFKVKLREIPFLVLFGVFGVALMQWAYSNAVSLLPVGIALLFEYTAIVMVPIASYLLFKQKTNANLWLGVVLVLGGLAVVSQIWQGGLNASGIGFALLAAVLLSTYFIMGERAGLNRDPVSTMFYTMLTATMFWLLFTDWGKLSPSLFEGNIDLSANLTGIEIPKLLAFAWLGIMGSFAPMVFSFIALKYSTATVVGIVSTAEPVFAFLFGWLWLSETISGLQLIGGLLVILGIVLAQTKQRISLRNRE